MAKSLNKVQLIGNVGQDPECGETNSNVKYATLSIATTESFTPKGGGNVVHKTEWHRLVCWRGLASIVEKYVKKGTRIYIEGKLTNREWETKEGEKRTTTEIVVGDLILLGSKNSNEKPPEPESETPKADNPEKPLAEGEDDLPF